MPNKKKYGESGSLFAVPLLLLNGIIIKYAFTVNEQYYWFLLIAFPLLIGVVIKFSGKQRMGEQRRIQVSRQARYSFEPEVLERMQKRRDRSAYARYRIFTKGR